MTAAPPHQGLLDTSTVIVLTRLSDPMVLPQEPLISTVTLAELSVGPLVAASEAEQATRQAHVSKQRRTSTRFRSTPLRPEHSAG